MCLFSVGSLAKSAMADKLPAIVTDLPVTHSLVAMVTGNENNPALLITGSASPHDYSLRPSEARQIGSADVLFWTSHELTPWLQRTLDNSRQSVPNVELMAAPQTLRLEYRNNSTFNHEHDHGSHEHEEPLHDDSQHSTPIDPHGWLDPVNAIYWLGLIADKLGELDPSNAPSYQNNANAARQNLEKLARDISVQLKPVSDSAFVVFHDSYHYYEQRFGVHAQAAIALGDAELPGIRRMNALKEQLRQYEGACVFTEPQFGDRIVNSLIRGLSVSTGTLDPLGANLQPGPELYPSVLQNIADELTRCFSTATGKR